MKFKGQTVKGSKKQYSLKQQFGEGGFSIIYTTSDPDIICKVQVLSNPEILKAYRNEKQALLELQHKNIVLLKDSFEIKEKDDYFGFLLLQNCNSGNAFNVLQSYGNNDVPQKLVLKIFYSVASALQYMHKKQIAHRDIKLENVLLNSKGQYKLCDFGSSNKEIIKSIDKSSRPDIQEYIQKTTTPLYRSPQQLDLYSGFQIGTKVDIFALGVLVFMLCFKKQPFQSRLSAINKQYFIPEQTSYSSELISLIQKCFTSNPRQRITASQIKKEIVKLMNRKIAQIQISIQKQLDSTLSEILKINNNMLKKSTEVASSSIFDKIKRFYNQITTQTQGWIASFVQDNEQAPQLKYNRSIISKCWEKRYKVEKMYEILYKYSEDYKNKSLVNVKLLILLHNFLRKGPSESINYDGNYSPNKLCTKIYKNWKSAQKPTDPQDIKRNSYLCLVIRYYCLILTAKWKLCYENSELIEGNFSILPFFQSKKEIAILKIQFISELIKFLEMCTQFHEILATHSYLIDIQRSIILSLVDQQYCCISLLVFLICGFKQAIGHFSEQLDIEKLSQQLRIIERDFQDLFKKLSKLFQSANKLASLFQEQTPFLLNSKILQYIKKIDIRQKKQGCFQFKKHISYQRSILGLKIPLSYEQAVKNPNFLKSLQKKDDGTVLQMNQYKIKKITNQQIQENKQFNNQLSNNISSSEKSPQNKSNQAFKKNKQNKIFTAQLTSTAANNNLQPQVLSLNSNNATNLKQINNDMMEFTHQNLNKDMNSQKKKLRKQEENSESSKSKLNQNYNNQFRDFLSIVDEKFTKSSSHPNKSFTKQFEQFDANIKTSKQQPVDFFNTFRKDQNNQNDDSKSKISSINSIQQKYLSKNNENNIFQQPFNNFSSTNGNSNTKSNFKQFQSFNKPNQNFIVINKTNSNKQSPKKQIQTGNANNSGSNEKKPTENSYYSSISSISKEVYNSLNKNITQDNKVQLMNFFDDEEQESEKNKQNLSKNNDLIDFQKLPSINKNIQLDNHNHINLLNKTGPEGFGHHKLHHNKSSNDIQHGGSSQQIDSDQKMFRTMPSDHSFIDLKGFIVEEVKKNAQQYFIDFSCLKFMGKVGFGHSSQVFKGQWRGRDVAIKRIKDNMSPSNAKEFKREIMTSVKIRHHPNLVTLIGIAQYQNQYYIINEFCNGATLFDFLHESNYVIPINVKISIAKQIAKGMLFLHTNDPPIIHRDLKSLNVLLVNKYNGEPEPQIKIADFGLSRDFASTYMTGTLGTYHWMAPQIFNNEPYSLKADVYSFGIVLWQILSRSPPYTNIKNPQSLMKFITLQNGRPDLNFISNDCPYQLKMLMIRCWDRFPQNRPNFKQILQTLSNIKLY